MTRKLTCHVYTGDANYVMQYDVMLAPMDGFTKPTVDEMDEMEEELYSKLWKTVRALRKAAHGSPFDLAVTVNEYMDVECPSHLQEQREQYDAERVIGRRI